MTIFNITKHEEKYVLCSETYYLKNVIFDLSNVKINYF